jgi:hypothetical protein
VCILTTAFLCSYPEFNSEECMSLTYCKRELLHHLVGLWKAGAVLH